MSYNRDNHPVSVELSAICDRMCEDWYNWTVENSPEMAGFLPEKSEFLADLKIKDQFKRMVGIPRSNFEWSLFTVGNITPELLNIESPQLCGAFSVTNCVPDAGLVFSFSEPVDLVKMTECMAASLREMLGEDYESLKNAVRVENIEINGNPARRISWTCFDELDSPEKEGANKAFSPVIATNPDRKLVFLGINEDCVRKFSDLYSGKTKAGSSAISEEINLPANFFSKVILDKSLFDLINAEGDAGFASMEKLRINSYFKEEGKKVCFSINGRFGDVSDAAEIKQKAEEFRQLAVMFVTFSNSMDDLDEEDKIFMEIVKSVVKYISIAEPEADNEVQLTLSVPLADLSNLDITKCMEAFGQFAPESALQKILKRPMGPYSSSVEMLDILDIGVGSKELDAVAAPDADAAAEGAL